MEVVNMNETSQEPQIGSTSLAPPKRKRGRPRKTHLLYPGEKTLVQLEGKKKTRRKKSESLLSSFAENVFVGQEVHGVLDGSFDAGYLLTVRVGDTDTVLRGVVFEPGSSVPISKANDIAPNVKMTRRDENTMAISSASTSVPFLTSPAPVMNSQGTTFVSIPEQTMPPLPAGLEQRGVVSLQPNGSPPKSVLHSGHVTEHPAPKHSVPVSQLQQHVSFPAKSFPYLQQAIPISSEPASHLQQSTCTVAAPVSHQQQATPIPAEPASHQLQPIPTPESASHSHQPIPPAEPKSQPHQPITRPPEPVGLWPNVKRE